MYPWCNVVVDIAVFLWTEGYWVWFMWFHLYFVLSYSCILHDSTSLEFIGRSWLKSRKRSCAFLFFMQSTGLGNWYALIGLYLVLFSLSLSTISIFVPDNSMLLAAECIWLTNCWQSFRCGSEYQRWDS